MNSKTFLPFLAAGLSLAGLTTARAQLQTAGEVFVNIDVTGASLGPVTGIANSGTLGGVFEPRGVNSQTIPSIAQVGGTKAIQFDGNDFLQLASAPAGALVPTPAGLIGPDPTRSIEVWALNPNFAAEETMVSISKRGGPDGSNLAFNYGNNANFGAVGHWAGADIGWNMPATGGAPEANKWHHLVYTYDGGTFTTRVYADGVLANSELLAAGAINTPQVTINLGTQLEADGATVTGALRARLAIARVRIHDGVLSDAQILSNYNLEKADFINPPPLTASPLRLAPVHRYSFSEPATANAADVTFKDSVGTADGIVRGAGGTLTGTRLTLPGGGSGTQAYGDLPNGLVSVNSSNAAGSGEVSIEGWVKVTGNRTWSRIFDFGSSGSSGAAGEVFGPGGGGNGLDYLFYSAQVGGDANTHRLELRNEDPGGGGVMTSDTGTATFNTDLHFTVTWKESNGELVAYENGKEVTFMFVDDAMSDLNDVNVWLGRSNWTADQNMQGEFDEVRIYRHVLSPGEVLGNFQSGPNQLVTADPVSLTSQPQSVTVDEGGTATFSVGAAGLPPISFQWYKNNVAIPGANSTTLSIGPVAGADQGATVYCVASNFVFGAGHLATSAAATITVNLDMVAPTITDVRAAGTSSIELIFSEAVQASTAEVVGNYKLSNPAGPVALSSAQALAPKVVRVTAAAPLDCGSYTLVVNGVKDASSTGNSIAADTTVSVFKFVPGGLVHRYTFNNLPAANAANATVEDLVAGANGTVRGAGASFTGSRLRLSGGGSGSSAYVDLPNGLLSVNSTNKGGKGELTFEGWVKITGNQTWSRIFDFGSSDLGGGVFGEVNGPGGGGEGKDYLFLSAQVGGDTATHRFELRNEDPAGGGTLTRDFSSTGFDRDLHYVVTWKESTGEIRAYENGVEGGVITVDDAMSDIHDVNVWLGRSNWTADSNAQGEFDEFRVYDRVLDPSEIAANLVLGPEYNNFGETGFLTFTAPDVVLEVGQAVQTHVGVDLLFAFDVNISRSPCITYVSSNPQVAVADVNGVVHALAPGGTDITAKFAGQEETQSFTVVPALLVSISKTAGGYKLRITGATPGVSYSIVRAAVVNGPYDTVITSQVAPASGVIEFEDTTAGGTQAFYQARTP